MAGPTTATRRREEEQGRRERQIVIPRRAGEAETEQWRHERDRAISAIGALTASSRQIRVPSDMASEIDSRVRSLEGLRRTGVPFLQDRYNNEIDMILAVLREARRASEAGRSSEAQPLLERGSQMMGFLGRMYVKQIGIFISMGRQMPGGTQGFTDLMDSFEIVILDVGTPNAQNAENVYAAAALLSDHSAAWNIEDVSVRVQRDRLTEFVLDHGIRRGTTPEARRARAHTERDAAQDRRTLESIQAYVTTLEAQLRSERVSQVSQWKDDVAARISALDSQDRTRQMMESLRSDLDSMLARLRRSEQSAREISDLEMLSLHNRYLTLSGRPPMPTRDERDEQLRRGASELRGPGRAVRENTPEWFGEQALAALARGDRDAAALAVSMGFLERTAAGARKTSADYLPEDRRRHIIDVVAQRAALNPVSASQLSTEIDIASIAADADRLARAYAPRGRGAARERLERIGSGVSQVRRRLANGDVEGARRLVDMLSTYASFMDSARGRAWAASAGMESGIDLELQGRSGQARFEQALTENAFASQVAEFRRGISDWGRGISAQRDAAESAVRRVEEIVESGDFRQAQASMLRIIMYAESIERLGVRRNGRIESMNPAFDGSGMERALRAFVRNESQVDGRGLETVFGESFSAAQRLAVDTECARIAELATRRRWTIGRETTDLALESARLRARQGDYEGAFRLLRFVQEYYGAPVAAQAASGGRPASPARSEGWRYQLIARDAGGLREGRRQMQDAIRMELAATTQEMRMSAAQAMQTATARIAECERLLASFGQLRQRYMGEADFVSGQGGTRGRLIIGFNEDRTPVYLDLALVRGYEAGHSRDAALGRGPNIEALFSRLEQAAISGDATAYNRGVEAIFGRYDSRSRQTVGGRFWLVANRAMRMQAIDQLQSQLGSLPAFVSGLPAYQGSAERRRTMETARAALVARLERMRNTAEELTYATTRPEERNSALDEYASLMSGLDRERRSAIAVAAIDEQVRLNGEYRRAVGYPGGEYTARTREHLDSCATLLQQARTEIISGRFEEGARLYERAIGSRTDAIQEYWARNVVTTSDVLSAHRARRFASGPDERLFPALRIQHDVMEVQPYLDAHRDVFRDLLFGSPSGDTRAYGERLQRRLQGTALIEASVFGIPAASTAQQVLGDFKRDQRDVRRSVYAAWRFEDQALRATDPAQRQEFMARSTSEWTESRAYMQEMQRRAERNQFVASVAVIVAGIGAAFIPVVGPYISAGVFIGMQADNIATEYRMDGHASTESWVMLGLTVATLGFASAGAILRTVATGARATGETLIVGGNIVRAEQLLTSAGRFGTAGRVMTGSAITIGLGMSGYMEYSAYSHYQMARRETDPVRRESLMRQAMLEAGMGLFPIVHMGSAMLYRGLSSSPRMRVSTALEEITPAREALAEAPLARRVRTPEGLFDFMRRLRSTESEVRAVAESELAALPESMRAGIADLAANSRVGNLAFMNLRAAMQSGEMTPFARADLEAALGRLGEAGPRPEPPSGGPGGGGPRTSRPEVDSAGLADARGLFGFLQDLMIPDTAAETALLSRASARATLARMRLDPRSQPIADMIDSIVGNPGRGIAGNRAVRAGVEGDVAFEALDPFTRRGLDSVADRIGEMVRPQVMRAMAVREATTGMLIEEPPAQAQIRPGEGIGGTVPVRAMAGEGPRAGGGAGGPRGPGEMASPRAAAMAEGGAPAAAGGRVAAGGRGGGPRAPRAGAPEEAPAEAAAGEAAPGQPLLRPGETYRVSRMGMLWRRVGAWRQTRRAAREEASLRTRSLGALEQTTDEQVARQLQTTARENPGNIVFIMRTLYERAMSMETSVTTQEQCISILQKLYSQPQVRAALSESARAPGAEPVFGQIEATIRRSVDAEIRLLGIRTPTEAQRQTYLNGLPDLTVEGRGLIVDSIELRGATMGAEPLTLTSRLLGIELSGQQRINTLYSLIERGSVTRFAIVEEMARARSGAASAIEGEATGGNPISQAIRAGLLRRVENNQAGSLETVLLESMRSPEVAQAVETAYGRQARTAYEGAVREGTLAQVTSRMPQAMRTALTEAPEGRLAIPEAAAARMVRGVEDAGAYVERLGRNQALADDSFVMGRLAEEYNAIRSQGRARGAAAAVAGRPFGVGSRAWQAVTGRTARFVYRVLEPTWGLRTGATEFYGEARAGGWRAGVRESLLTGRTVWRLAHAGLWAGFVYYWPGPEIAGLFGRDVRAGQRYARENLGISVNDENARWLSGEAGRNFGTSLVFGERWLAPSNAADLQAMLRASERGEIWIDSAHANDALSDGRAMANALSRIGADLRTATTAQGEDRTAARTSLNDRLAALGITTADIRSALTRQRERSLRRPLNDTERAEIVALEGADALAQFLSLRGRSEPNMQDMTELRIDDWMRRGVAIDSRRAAVETYLTETGMSGDALTRATDFFTRGGNEEAFLFVWTSARAGNIPAAYVDDVVSDLLAGTTLSTMQSRAGRGPQAVAADLRGLVADMPPEYLQRVSELERTASSGASAAERESAGRELSALYLGELLRRRAIEQGRYFEIPDAAGTLRGIQPNTFLHLLDRRAYEARGYQRPFEEMLGRYGTNPAALRAFNAFIINDGENIYGDPNVIAARLAQIGGNVRGSDGTERPFADEVNRLLALSSSAAGAQRQAAQTALQTLLGGAGLTLQQVRTRLTVSGRQEIMIEDCAQMLMENARAEGIIGIGDLATAQDQSMYGADSARLVLFVRRNSRADGVGLQNWIRDNRQFITNLRGILNWLEQNPFLAGGARSPQEVAAFADRNGQTFRDNGWLSPTARTRGEAEAERIRRLPPDRRPRPAPGTAPAGRVRQFPGVVSLAMVPSGATARQAQPAGETARTAFQLTAEQAQQAGAFFQSQSGRDLLVRLEGQLTVMFRENRDALIGAYPALRADADGNPVFPEGMVRDVGNEIFRILSLPSTAPAGGARDPTVDMREAAGISLSGTGGSMVVRIPATERTNNFIKRMVLAFMNRRGEMNRRSAPAQESR